MCCQGNPWLQVYCINNTGVGKMWLTEEWGKMKKCLACLCAWGRVGSRSSETDLPLQVADLSSAGENKESKSIIQK